MRLSILMSLCLIFFISHIHAQKYEDYIGAGHNRDIKVFSSSEMSESITNYSAKAINTINGKGMDGKLMETSRFLSQATLGPDYKTIKNVTDIGIEPWLDSQLGMPAPDYLQSIRDIFQITTEWQLNHGVDSSDLSDRSDWSDFMYAWWEYNLFNDDLVRQKVALALSEIFVISFNSDLSGFGDGVASYYDILSSNAFGNYKDILMQVSLHPTMGFYLSHFNNPRAIPEENIHPDENYAREIMQLFSIGLYELNNDGTRKKDADGNFIPTYTNDQIKEMAKVFTGLGPRELVPNEWTDDPEFGIGVWITDMTKPMKMYEEWHEPGEKHLLNGYVIPAGNSGDKDIQLAIDHLFNHPNVGPFICKQLIQRLVKSNPTPEYVDRIATVFNSDNNGVRGNLKATIKAILLDREARDCDWINDDSNGRLREPLLRYTHFARAMDKDQAYGNFWNIGWSFWSETGQMVLGSPSVFNFFLPYYQPNGAIANKGLIAPEFQIHNSKTSIGYINEVYDWIVYEVLMNDWLEDSPHTNTDFYNYEIMNRDPEVFINYLDIVYTYGMLSDRTRKIIKNNSNKITYGDFKRSRAKLALYLMMISPDYNISK